MKYKYISLIFILGVVGLYHNLLLKAQEPEKQLEKPKHEILVTLKLLEVFVVDKNGNPIKDLGVEDFVVFENGNVKSISYFEKREYQTDILEDKELKSLEREYKKSREGRKLFLFFDLTWNISKGMERARESALHLLETQVTPEDLLSVISYSQLWGGLKIHEFLTQDNKKIKKIVKEIGVKEAIGSAVDMEILYGEPWEEQIELGPMVRDDEALKKKGSPSQRRLEKLNLKATIHNFCSELIKLAQLLRHIEGYKHIIYFSTGVDSFALYGKPESLKDIYYPMYYSRLGQDWGDPYLRNVYESAAKELAASNCLIYSVNTEGILNTRELAFMEAGKGEHSLSRLSQLTGGKYYGPREDLKPVVEDIAKRTSFYYVLGIPVKEKMDGKFHKIEVKVKRKGVKVHAPSGYYNPKPFQEYNEFERFIHLVDSALSERPLFQEVKEFPVSLTHREGNIYEIFFEISAKEFQIEEGMVEVFIIFLDSGKEIIRVRKEKVRKVGERFTYLKGIDFPEGTSEVRIVVRDLSTGKSLRGVAGVKEQ